MNLLKVNVAILATTLIACILALILVTSKLHEAQGVSATYQEATNYWYNACNPVGAEPICK